MIKFKSPEVESSFSGVSKKLRDILSEMGWFCVSKKLDFTLTEALTTKEHDRKLGRVSDSHNEGRAVDVRTREWPEQFTKEFVNAFNSKYGHLGAKSKSDGQRRFIVDKSNTSKPHLHIQLGREFMEES